MSEMKTNVIPVCNATSTWPVTDVACIGEKSTRNERDTLNSALPVKRPIPCSIEKCCENGIAYKYAKHETL